MLGDDQFSIRPNQVHRQPLLAVKSIPRAGSLGLMNGDVLGNTAFKYLEYTRVVDTCCIVGLDQRFRLDRLGMPSQVVQLESGDHIVFAGNEVTQRRFAFEAGPRA